MPCPTWEILTASTAEGKLASIDAHADQDTSGFGQHTSTANEGHPIRTIIGLLTHNILQKVGSNGEQIGVEESPKGTDQRIGPFHAFGCALLTCDLPSLTMHIYSETLHLFFKSSPGVPSKVRGDQAEERKHNRSRDDREPGRGREQSQAEYGWKDCGEKGKGSQGT